MAERPAFNQYKYTEGYVYVTWAGLLNGDTGQVFDCGGWRVHAIEWRGTPGGSFTGSFQATLTDNPTNLTTLSGWAATAAGIVFPTTQVPLFPRLIRPSVAGDGSTNIAAHVLLVRP